jgi:hypothetical protein
MTVTVDRRQNLKPHKADFWYGHISENSHTKKYGNMLKRVGIGWNDCGNNKRCPRNRLPPDGGILLLSSRHPFQINDRSDDHVITCRNYKNTDWFISAGGELKGNTTANKNGGYRASSSPPSAGHPSVAAVYLTYLFRGSVASSGTPVC